MPDSLDPYYDWFGIRPDDQPPTHYRLLGIEELEDEFAVIDEAYYRRKGYLREFLGGPHHDQTLRMVEELAAARECLLNPVAKLAYDADLLLGPACKEVARKHQAAAEVDVPNSTPVPPPVTDVGIVSRTQKPAGVSATRPRIRRPVSFTIVSVIALLAASAVVIPAVFLDQENDQDNTDDAGNQQIVESEPPMRDQQSARTTTDSDATGDDLVEKPPSLELADEKEPQHEPEVAPPPTDNEEVAADSDSHPTPHHVTDDVPAKAAPVKTTSPRDGLVLWLDAANTESLQANESGRVELWRDLSGAGNHASSQSSAAPVAASVSSAKSVLRFDGNQFLTVANEDRFDFGDAYSIIFVAAGETGVLADKGDGYREGAFSFWNGVKTFRTHNRMIHSGDEAPGSFKVRSVVCDDDVRWFVDRELTAENTSAHAIENDEPLLIGSRGKASDRRGFAGQLAELIIYDRALSNEERIEIEDSLRAKWLTKPGGPLGDVAMGSTGGDEHFVVEHKVNPDTAKIAGEITREIWHNCKGNTIEDVLQTIEQRLQPDSTSRIKSFETPENFADNYAQRIRGYLHPPQTGEYSFSIKANAVGALLISTDATPDNKRRLEKAEKVRLTAGEVYYIEALHKESTGLDHFTVGWTLPSGETETPIPGARLSVEARFVPPHETRFVVLKPHIAVSSHGAVLTILEDGSILASGDAETPETYEILIKPEMDSLTAFCLEATQHDSLPSNGPGLGLQGKFLLAELSLDIIDGADREKVRRGDLTSITRNDRGVERLLDGDPKTKWLGGPGRNRFAVASLSERMKLAKTAEIRIRLNNSCKLGSFRLLATSAADSVAAFDRKSPADNKGKRDFHMLVNVRGGAHTDPRGDNWLASRDFDGTKFGCEGGTAVTKDDADDPLAGSAQRGILAFRAVVPNGTYEVGLYFCEYWTDDPARRVFSATIENKVVLKQFELLRAAGGKERPFIFPVRRVAVTDGRLDIDFKPARPDAAAILNAVSIRAIR